VVSTERGAQAYGVERQHLACCQQPEHALPRRAIGQNLDAPSRRRWQLGAELRVAALPSATPNNDIGRKP